METKKIILPEGWEIDKVENGEIILKETKKELPKTWGKCVRQVGKCEYIPADGIPITIDSLRDFKSLEWYHNTIPVGYGNPMIALCKLLVCREVYRQGWKPNWNNNDTKKYIIVYRENDLVLDTAYCVSHVLSFQTPEIREEFMNNFKNLIEEAKELI